MINEYRVARFYDKGDSHTELPRVTNQTVVCDREKVRALYESVEDYLAKGRSKLSNRTN